MLSEQLQLRGQYSSAAAISLELTLTSCELTLGSSLLGPQEDQGTQTEQDTTSPPSGHCSHRGTRYGSFERKTLQYQKLHPYQSTNSPTLGLESSRGSKVLPGLALRMRILFSWEYDDDDDV
jgi:hypothetical protein